MTLFRNLHIQRLIAHKIFKRYDAKSALKPSTPTYSRRLVNLPDEPKDTLIKRVIKALDNKYCLELEQIRLTEETVYARVLAMLGADENTFIEQSQKITGLLWEAQRSPIINGGVIIIADGIIGYPSRSCCIVIKAEEDVGFSAKDNGDAIELDYMKELFLTDSQKFQKIAIFIAKSNNQLEVYASDQQARYSEGIYKANFFVTDFLGCNIADSAKTQTQAFFNRTQEVVDSLEISASEKLQLRNAVYSYIGSAQPNISVSEFADVYIQNPAIRDNFRSKAHETLPNIGIPKDITLVERQLKRQEFSVGAIKIVGPSENFAASVEIEESDGYVTVRIRGQLEDV